MEGTEELLEDENGKSIPADRILDAAYELFASRGIEPVTMEDIAQKAKITPSILYRYFESKDSLHYRNQHLGMMTNIYPRIIDYLH